jgi:NAD(P)H-dependent flavin oxidoreductase YrpB (nitropropane dioxygenase family)
MLGTRFVATLESHAHPAYKQTITGAHATTESVLLSMLFGREFSAATAERLVVIRERQSPAVLMQTGMDISQPDK